MTGAAVAGVGLRIWVRAGMAALAVALAGVVQAATLSPADVGGAYSDSYASPTQIGTGYDTILGTATNGQSIALELTGLPAGAQTLTFTFTAAPGVTPQGVANGWAYYGAGGSLLYSTGSAFTGPWSGASVGGFGIANTTADTMTNVLTLTLDSTFSGALYLGLNMTYGNTPIAYSIGVPSNAAVTAITPPPAPVPLPPGALMLASVLGGLWLIRRRRSAA